MISVKPAGYFAARADEGRFTRFMRESEPSAAQLPGPITDWDVDPASSSTWHIDIRALPSPGDLDHWGDGAGVITAIQWRQDEGDPVSLGSVVPQTFLVTAPGAASIGVRVTASAGAGEWADIAVVAVDVPNLLLVTGDDDADLRLEGGGQLLLFVEE